MLLRSSGAKSKWMAYSAPWRLQRVSRGSALADWGLDGDLDLALFYADNSLRHNGNQPELRELRTAVTGESDDYWERSLTRRILEDELRFNDQPGDLGPGAAATPVGEEESPSMRTQLSTATFGSSGF